MRRIFYSTLSLMCLCVVLLVAGALAYTTAHRPPLIFSPTQVLNATWNEYKREYVEPTSGRTMDTARQNITTSEGEGYTMMRAVWLGDKDTFDASWNFTKQQLQHTQGDALFSWLYGKRSDGSYGVLFDQGGLTTATDADSDIALSLVFAYARWQNPSYLAQAKRIIPDIWTQEVLTINGTPYLVANNIEKKSSGTTALVNPSYFSPYAYRIFALVDPTHPWNALADSSYTVLSESMRSPLGAARSSGLPPDWLSVQKTTGAIQATGRSDLDTNYGFDALRIPWRIALDWQWFGTPAAKNLLENFSLLGQTWQSRNTLPSIVGHDGSVVGAYETPAMYGGAMGYFAVAHTQDTRSVYETKLIYLYDPDINSWRSPLSYYDDNWIWFGIAQYNALLPNLAAGVPASAFR